MNRLMNYLRGSVKLTVAGAFPERFLNLCAQHRVTFWNLTVEDPHTLTLCVTRKDSRKARRLAQQVMCTVERDKSAGLPWFLCRFRRRHALVAGLCLSVAAVLILSQFVLTIDVSGNETVPTAVILSELRRQGVKPGVYGPGLDLRNIRQEVLLDVPDLAWMAINLHGTRAEVLVREKLPVPEVLDTSVPTHVVASATGIITHIQPMAGQPLFKAGDTVLEGEVVISGIIDIQEPQYSEADMGTEVVRARGKVWARTWRTLTAEIPLTAQVKTYTGETKVRHSLNLLGHRVNFYGNSGIPMEEYDKITTVRVLTLPGGREMPLSLSTESYRGYTTAEAALNTGAAEDLLKTHLEKRLQNLIGEDGQVLRTDYTAKCTGNLLTVTLLAECSEQIGREVTFPGTVGRYPSGNSAES